MNLDNLNILFFGGCYSETEKARYFDLCIHGYQSAAQVHQEAILRGFIQNNVDVEVLSLPFLPSFPFNYRSVIVKSCDFILDSKCIGKSMRMINLPYFKYNEGKVLKEISEWNDRKRGDKVILLYSLNYFWFRVALLAKQKFADIHFSVVVPDLPIFCETGRASRFLGKENNQLDYITNNIHLFDSFVLLSEPMAEALNVNDKPYLVVEGVYNQISTNIEPEIRDRKYILYTGKLSVEFGLKDLVDAFLKTSNKDIDLVLCGDGNMVSYIKECAKKDLRIQFLGTVTNEKCVQLQRGAYLLVNPRHSYEEFTKYSFPSKTFEYMASGVPTLMCKLQCLPEEYKTHLLLFDMEDVDNMAKKIEQVLKIPEAELRRIGDEARRFILEKKTPKAQMFALCKFLYGQFH